MAYFSTMRSALILGTTMLAVGTLQADTLLLNDGRRLQGELISVRNGVIEFQEERGRRTVRIDRDQVRGIEFNSDDRSPGRNIQQGSGRPRGLREKQIMVVASAAWTDTGIDISAGQNVYFESVGEIRWGPNRRAGPSGERNSPTNPMRPMPNRPGASLIGRIGDSSDYFFLGDDRGAIRMRSSGRLYLGINDDNLQDNTGYFTVIAYY